MCRFAMIALAIATSPPADSAGGGDPAAELTAAGRVTFAYYDESKERPEHRGQAQYDLRYRRSYSYTPRVRTSRGGRTLVLSVRYADVDVWVEHTVRLPRGHDPSAEPWYKALIAHELDHVAVSTDERPRLLLKELLGRPQVLERSLAPGASPDKAMADAMIAEAADSHHEAIVRLIRENYERLDDLTDHGTRPIPDRARFFDDLYSPGDLQRRAFPHLERVGSLLRGKAYVQAKRYGGR